MVAADAPSRSHQAATLSVGGRSFSGWSVVRAPDHDVPTGRHTPAGSRGDVVYAGRAAAGGQYVLEKELAIDEYRFLQARKGRSGTIGRYTIDDDGRKLDSLGSAKGRLRGVTAEGLDTASGDVTKVMVRFEAGGELAL